MDFVSKVVLVALALLGNAGELNGFFPADDFVVGACFRVGGGVAPAGLGLVRDGFGCVEVQWMRQWRCWCWAQQRP